MALDAIWSRSFPNQVRPQLYTSDEYDDHGYLPLNDASEFLVDDITKLTRSQLYALSANNALALQQAQEEHHALEKVLSEIKHKDVSNTAPKDPQSLMRPELFDERKQAKLYGYNTDQYRKKMLQKYGSFHDHAADHARLDSRELPNPFAERGLIPTEKQHKQMLENARDKKNPDNLEAYTENFAFAPVKGKRIPKLQVAEGAQMDRYLGRTPTTAKGGPQAVVDTGGSEVAESSFSGQSTQAGRDLTGGRQTRYNGTRIPETRASPFPQVSASASGRSTPRGRKAASPSIADQDGPRPKRIKLTHSSNASALSNKPTTVVEKQSRETRAISVAPPSPTTQAQRPSRMAADGNGSPRRQAVPRASSTARQPARPGGVKKGRASRAVTEDTSSGAANQALDAGGTAPNKTKTAPPQFKDNTELLEAIQQDYSFLHDDPVKANLWRTKVTNAPNPNRTWAMLCKWDHWKAHDLHKRPRNKKPLGRYNNAEREDANET